MKTTLITKADAESGEYSFEYDADDFGKLYEVDVEMTAEGEDGREEFEDSTFFVAKIDGEWLVVWIED